MGLYDLGSCAGLFGFERATTVDLQERGSSETRREEQAVVFALW